VHHPPNQLQDDHFRILRDLKQELGNSILLSAEIFSTKASAPTTIERVVKMPVERRVQALLPTRDMEKHTRLAAGALNPVPNELK
jgi:hypothetical protein